MSSHRRLDKFYTNEDVASSCVARLESLTGPLVTLPYPTIEPSAGAGAFLPYLPPTTKAYDIAPEAPGIIKRNFLTLKRKQPALVIGNPPFGKNASLAITFFNHAARFAPWIAFIVPRSFEKTSTQNKLDMNFILVDTMPLNPDSFHFNNKPYLVPCCFQIWQKTPTPRLKLLLPTTHSDFVFTTPEQADFALQRVGVNAGRIKSLPGLYGSTSHYFIKSIINPFTLRKRFDTLDFSVVKIKTAGNPSISKTEIISLYIQSLQSS